MRKPSGSERTHDVVSMSNCALVHAPCADVNGEVVARVSAGPAQIAIDPP